MEHKQITPLKLGIFIVAVAYFLFTLHATFTLSWIGEWNAIQDPTTRFWIFLTDVVAGTFLSFRFIASVVALSTVLLYFARGLPQSTVNKILRVVLVFEGLYWLGLLPSGIWGIVPTAGSFNLGLLVSTGIPCLVSSIGMPIALFTLAYKLGPNKPQSGAIKWALIAGVLYIAVLWLNNTGVWLINLLPPSSGSIIVSTESKVSLVLTVAGLLALLIYAAYFAKKSMGADSVWRLSLGSVGAIMVALGAYFLWNYLTWIFWGGWNEWYAWFLGHNLDLWLLSLPLLGLPLLFYHMHNQESS